MTTQEKPIILLLHGAWHIPLHYRTLIDRLRISGYTVLAPYQVTTGYDDSVDDKTHVDSTNQIRDYLRPILDQGRKIVIVAHSAGGVVATGAAIGSTLEDRSAQGLQGGIISIVYIAALIEPQHGRPDKPIPFPPGWTDVSFSLLPFHLCPLYCGYHRLYIPLLGAANSVIENNIKSYYIILLTREKGSWLTLHKVQKKAYPRGLGSNVVI